MQSQGRTALDQLEPSLFGLEIFGVSVAAQSASLPIVAMSRHGCPFPLELRAVPENRRVPRYLARRLRKRASKEELVSDAVRSLNALYFARASGVLSVEEPRHASFDRKVSATNDLVLNSLGRCVSMHWPRPSEFDVSPDGALCELLKSRDIYDTEPDTTTRPYESGKVRVLAGKLHPKDAKDLVGSYARRFLEDPRRYIFKSDSEINALGAPTRPHWDQKLKYSRKQRRSFIELLRKAGLIAWRRKQQCEGGVFFGAKKDGALRLILDCRPVNECCKDPPYSNLATPSCIAGVNLSDEWFQKCGSEDLQFMSEAEFAELGDFDVYAAGADLEDGFYPFLARWETSSSANCTRNEPHQRNC